MNPVLDEPEVRLPKKFLKGSKFRFLMLTSMPKEQVAGTLTELVSPLAYVDIHDQWMPGGFLKPEEARLDVCPQFLEGDLPRQLARWYLGVEEAKNSPNWDLVSTCKINGKKGFILIEGKAHSGELDAVGKGQDGDPERHHRIKGAIEEANERLRVSTHDWHLSDEWHLSRDSHYQLSNRFAWAWKLATLGFPTILIYLGFLRATEMKEPFASAEHWDRSIREFASPVVPKNVWGRCLQTSPAQLWALIRSIDLRWVVAGQVSQ
jgi:hypothetical protein